MVVKMQAENFKNSNEMCCEQIGSELSSSSDSTHKACTEVETNESIPNDIEACDSDTKSQSDDDTGGNYIKKLRKSKLIAESETDSLTNNPTQHFSKEAQTISRNKDLYLKLVNTAIYGNFNYKYYENPTNFNNAAEYFALYGFGDSLDSTFQFDSCNKPVEIEDVTFKSRAKDSQNPLIVLPELFKINNNKINNGNNLVSTPTTAVGHLQHQFFPKVFNFLTSQQQVLTQINQSAATPLMQFGPTPIWLPNTLPFYNATNAAAAAYFNETQINTSVIQQQQYNYFGAVGPYDLQYLSIYYAQLLYRSQQIMQLNSTNSRLFEQNRSRPALTASSIATNAESGDLLQTNTFNNQN